MAWKIGTEFVEVDGGPPLRITKVSRSFAYRHDRDARISHMGFITGDGCWERCVSARCWTCSGVAVDCRYFG